MALFYLMMMSRQDIPLVSSEDSQRQNQNQRSGFRETGGINIFKDNANNANNNKYNYDNVINNSNTNSGGYRNQSPSSYQSYGVSQKSNYDEKSRF